MNPRAALDEQIARYRRMTDEQRLGIAGALHEFACDVAREGIRARRPEGYLEHWAQELGLEALLRDLLEGTIRPKST